MSKTIIVLV